MIEKNAKIFICGHRGMVGSACVRKFEREGYTGTLKRTHAELDLRNQTAVKDFFDAEKPDYVVLAGAKVGGIMANKTHCAEFLLENLELAAKPYRYRIQLNIQILLFHDFVQ